MKLIGTEPRDRAYEITSAIQSFTYHLEKLTTQEALIALDAVRTMVQTHMNAEWSQNLSPGLTKTNAPSSADDAAAEGILS
jgi:hypothetical protein